MSLYKVYRSIKPEWVEMEDLTVGEKVLKLKESIIKDEYDNYREAEDVAKALKAVNLELVFILIEKNMLDADDMQRLISAGRTGEI